MNDLDITLPTQADWASGVLLRRLLSVVMAEVATVTSNSVFRLISHYTLNDSSERQRKSMGLPSQNRS